MPRISGYVHQMGRHCRSAALRNLSDFYEWEFDEPACFGFGAGLASVYTEHPGRPSKAWSGVAPWLERAFFERLEIPHRDREGDDWDAAWDDVTGHVDTDDPVLLFLDPAALDYLAEAHAPPHPVVAIGYDDDSVLVSDATVEERREIPRADLREAWQVDGLVSTRNRRLVVTRGRVVQDRQTAATQAVSETAEYMLRPLDARRTTRGPGEEGLPALQSLAADLPSLGDHDDPAERIDAVLGGVVTHGVDAAFRDLYADAIEDLESWARAGGDKGERMRDVATDWRRVGELLSAASEADDPDDAATLLTEAGGVLGDVADREKAIFEAVEAAVG